jgi:hypothetical protein
MVLAERFADHGRAVIVILNYKIENGFCLFMEAPLTGLDRLLDQARAEHLDLSHDKIGDEGARAIAASPPGLTSLSLSGNNIGADGAKALLDVWSSERKSGQLSCLSLIDNGAIGALLPKEVLDAGDAQAILAAYRRFVLAQQK